MSQIALPVIASLQNIAFCLDSVFSKAHFDTLALVHLNTTADKAQHIHKLLTESTHYAWIRYDMTNASSVKRPSLSEWMTNLFFLFIVDDFMDGYEFFIKTKFSCRDKIIFVLNKYPKDELVRRNGTDLLLRYLFNAATLFWNANGDGTGLEMYRFNGLQEQFLKIPLSNDEYCSSDIHDKLFPPDDGLFNLYGAEMKIYGQTDPPRLVRTVAMVNGEYEDGVGGYNLLIAQTIFTHLNATPKFHLMNYVLQLRETNPQRANYTIEIKQDNNTELRRFYVTESIPCIWTVPSPGGGVGMLYTQPGVDINSQQTRFDRFMEPKTLKDYTFLYPHDTDNYIVIVPKIFKSNTEYTQIFKSPLLYVWMPVVTVVAVTLFIFKKVKKTNQKFIDIFFQIFGLSLSISFESVESSGAENLLLWSFCMGTMLSGMLLSSIMFQGFTVQTNILTITNLVELQMSGLPVWAPSVSESVRQYFQDLPLKLKQIYVPEFKISDTIFGRNMSNAYIIRESKFNVLFGSDDDKKLWHVIERFGFEQLSFKLHFLAGLEDTVNAILHRCLDHGIISYLKAKGNRLLLGARPESQDIVLADVDPITKDDMKNSYLLYAFGIAFGLITFIVEKIRFKRRLDKVDKRHLAKVANRRLAKVDKRRLAKVDKRRLAKVAKRRLLKVAPNASRSYSPVRDPCFQRNAVLRTAQV